MSRLPSSVALICLILLAGCDRPAPPPAADVEEFRPPALTVEELRARALESEAEADRLLAELNGSKAADRGLSGTLAAGDEQRKTGQYFDSVSVEGQPGQTVDIVYDTKGYQGVLIVMDPNGKIENQSDGSAPDNIGASQTMVSADIHRAGTWRVLLSSSKTGDTGSYELHISKVTASTP